MLRPQHWQYPYFGSNQSKSEGAILSKLSPECLQIITKCSNPLAFPQEHLDETPCAFLITICPNLLLKHSPLDVPAK